MCRDNNHINDLNELEKLIYELIFGENDILNIILDDYVNKNQRTNFKDKIRNIAKRAKVDIIDDRIIHTDVKLIWKIEVVRK